MQSPSAVLLAWGTRELQHTPSQHANTNSPLGTPRSPMRVVVHPNAASSWGDAVSASSSAGSIHVAYTPCPSSNRSSTDSFWQGSTLSQTSTGKQYSTLTSSLRSSVDMRYSRSSAEFSGMATPRSLDAQRSRHSSMDLLQVPMATTPAAVRTNRALNQTAHPLMAPGAGGLASTGPCSTTGAADSCLPHKGNGKSHPGAREIAYIAKLLSSKHFGASALPPRGNGRSLPGGRELGHLAAFAAADKSGAVAGSTHVTG